MGYGAEREKVCPPFFSAPSTPCLDDCAPERSSFLRNGPRHARASNTSSVLNNMLCDRSRVRNASHIFCNWNQRQVEQRSKRVRIAPVWRHVLRTHFERRKTPAELGGNVLQRQAPQHKLLPLLEHCRLQAGVRNLPANRLCSRSHGVLLTQRCPGHLRVIDINSNSLQSLCSLECGKRSGWVVVAVGPCLHEIALFLHCLCGFDDDFCRPCFSFFALLPFGFLFCHYELEEAEMWHHRVGCACCAAEQRTTKDD